MSSLEHGLDIFKVKEHVAAMGTLTERQFYIKKYKSKIKIIIHNICQYLERRDPRILTANDITRRYLEFLNIRPENYPPEELRDILEFEKCRLETFKLELKEEKSLHKFAESRNFFPDENGKESDDRIQLALTMEETGKVFEFTADEGFTDRLTREQISANFICKDCDSKPLPEYKGYKPKWYGYHTDLVVWIKEMWNKKWVINPKGDIFTPFEGRFVDSDNKPITRLSNKYNNTENNKAPHEKITAVIKKVEAIKQN